MTTKAKAILASVALVGAGLLYLNGTVPDSPPPAQRVCARVLLQLDCSDAKLLARSPDDVPCQSGEVGIWTEVVGSKVLDEPLVLTDWLPGNVAREVERRVEVLTETARIIDCAVAKRPEKVLTPLRWVEVDSSDWCIAGCVSRDTSEHHDGSRWRTWSEPYACCGDRCRCDSPPCVTVPSMALAGRETWRARLEEQRPGLVCP